MSTPIYSQNQIIAKYNSQTSQKFLDEFGNLFGFKVDHSKSIFMPLNSGGSNFPNNIQISI